MRQLAGKGLLPRDTCHAAVLTSPADDILRRREGLAGLTGEAYRAVVSAGVARRDV